MANKNDAKVFKEILKVLKDMNEAEKGFENISDAIKDAVKNQDELTKKAIAYGIKGKKSYVAVAEEIAEIEKNAGNAGKQLDEIGTGFGHLGKMFKAPAGQMRAAAEGAATWADKVKATAEASKGMTGPMALAAKAAGKVGIAVGGISEMLTGPTGIALMAGKVIMDAAMQYDSFIKGLNKNFAMVRGPQIMTSDVSGQMKEFNKAIFNIGANIRDGLDNKEVYQFVTSLSDAGMALTNINDGFYNYRDAVKIGAKASAVFGMDLTQTASIMENMMMGQRMSLGEVKDAFEQVSFAAQKSGLSSDRFWQSIKNATASLGFYGKFIKGISKEVAYTQQSKVAGSTETSDILTTITQNLAKMESTSGQPAAFMMLSAAGGRDWGAEAGKKIAEATQEQFDLKKELSGLETALETTNAIVPTGTADEKDKQDKINQLESTIESVNNQINAAEGRLSRLNEFQKAAKEGDYVTASKNLGAMSDTNLGSMKDMMSGFAKTLGTTLHDIGGLQEIALIKMVKDTGALTDETSIKTLIAMFKGSGVNSDKAVGYSGDDTKSFVALAEKLLASGKTLGQGVTSGDLSGMGVQGPNQKFISQLISANPKFGEKLDEIIGALKVEDKGRTPAQKAVLKNMKASLSEAADMSNTLPKLIDVQTEDQGKSAKDIQASYDDTFDQIRDNTLSFEKMRDIVKDGAKVALGQLGILKGIDTWITKIGTRYLSDHGGSSDIEKSTKKWMTDNNIGLFQSTEKTLADYSNASESLGKKLFSGKLDDAAAAETEKQKADIDGVISTIRNGMDNIDEFKVKQYRDDPSSYEVLPKDKPLRGFYANTDPRMSYTAQTPSAPIFSGGTSGSSAGQTPTINLTINASDVITSNSLSKYMTNGLNAWAYHYSVTGLPGLGTTPIH